MSAQARRLDISARANLALMAAAALAVVAAVTLGKVFGASWDAAVLSGFVVASASAIGLLALRRRRREQADRAAYAAARAAGVRGPASLHPVIDPDICIGSLSCLEVCPEGDILGVVDGKAALIDPSACIGHGKCALECPVGAIKLVFGTSQRGVDLPELNDLFESSRPGVHIIGELGGMGLIRNAMTQGVELAEGLARRLPPPAGQGLTDVIIVGAGPAGFAAALGLKAQGRSFRLLDQQALGGAIFSYPRQKVVMTEPVSLPLHGKFGKHLISKEELLETLEQALRRAKIQVEAGTRVTGIEGVDGDFTVHTSAGLVRGRKVVLAIGRRGSPRRLGVPGEDLPKVTYALTDPTQYEGARVLVVGGGDSALEAALQLVDETDAQVTLSYRNAAFGSAREANKRKVHAYAERGRLTLHLSSKVLGVSEGEVSLSLGNQTAALPNDFVLACLGGELPGELLTHLGVRMRRYFEAAPGSTGNFEPEAHPKVERGRARKLAEARSHRRLVLTLTAIGVGIVALLTAVGWDYYRLDATARMKSAAHELLRPAGAWGHGVGIVATAFMMSNFAYALRKRWRALKGRGSIRRWLTFHQFVGFMSPLVICFHAAFQSNNVLATSTAASLAVVVGTGVVGRFVFGLLSDDEGRTAEYAELVGRWERHLARIESLTEGVTNVIPVRQALARVTTPVVGGSAVAMLAALPAEALRSWVALLRIQRLFPSRGHFLEFRAGYQHLFQLRTQVGFYRGLKRLLGVWRIFHVGLAIFLVLMISAHIGVSLYFGYKWIF